MEMTTRSIELRTNVGTHNSNAKKKIYLFLLYRVFRTQSLVYVTGTWRMVSIMLTLLLELVHQVSRPQNGKCNLCLLYLNTVLRSACLLSAWLLFNYREFLFKQNNPTTTKRQYSTHFRVSCPFLSHGKNVIYLITLYCWVY